MAVSREPEFRTVRMREGYDLDAVDDFVDRVIDALEGRGAGRGLTPEQIEGEEFKVVRMREGYVMDDVDDWLDSAAAELRRARNAGPGATQHGGYDTHAHPAPVQAHTQVQPQVGFSAPATPPPVVPPPVAPPAAAPPTAAPPTPSPYVGAPGTQPGHQTTGHGFDPLSDTALNELDPVLRALDPSFGRQQPQQPQPPQAPPPQAAPQHQPPPEPRAEEQTLSGIATPSTGLHHIELWVRDLDAATASLGWLFERLGWTLFQVWENGRSWQAPGGGPYVVVERSPDLTWVAHDRKAPGLNHLALAVPERWMVDRIVSEATSYGWHLMFADRHPHAGGPHHYAAYLENDEGFEVEVVAP